MNYLLSFFALDQEALQAIEMRQKEHPLLRVCISEKKMIKDQSLTGGTLPKYY